MGFIGANLFLFLLVAVVAGYGWLAIWMLKITGLFEYGIMGLPAGVMVLVASYFTLKYLHGLVQKRL